MANQVIDWLEEEQTPDAIQEKLRRGAKSPADKWALSLLAQLKCGGPTVGHAVGCYRRLQTRPGSKTFAVTTQREHIAALREFGNRAIRKFWNGPPPEATFALEVLDSVPLALIDLSIWREIMEEVRIRAKSRKTQIRAGVEAKRLGAVKSMFSEPLPDRLRKAGMPLPASFLELLTSAKGKFDAPIPLHLMDQEELSRISERIIALEKAKDPVAPVLELALLYGIPPSNLGSTRRRLPNWLKSEDSLLIRPGLQNEYTLPVPRGIVQALRDHSLFGSERPLSKREWEEIRRRANAIMKELIPDDTKRGSRPLQWLASHGQLRQRELGGRIERVSAIAGLKPDSLKQKFGNNEMGQAFLGKLAELEAFIAHTH